MALTYKEGNRAIILIQGNRFYTVEDALAHYKIKSTQAYSVKNFFNIEQVHQAILICLNYGINEDVRKSLNLTKFLQFLSFRARNFNELLRRSDSKAIAQFVQLGLNKRGPLSVKEILERRNITKEMLRQKEAVIRQDVYQEAREVAAALTQEVIEKTPIINDSYIYSRGLLPQSEKAVEEEKPAPQAPQEEEVKIVKKAAPPYDFNSFTERQDYERIGMQMVLASNLKMLKELMDVVDEVNFPLPDEELHRTLGDLKPLAKLVADSIYIVEQLLDVE